jgi:hypothetical protein
MMEIKLHLMIQLLNSMKQLPKYWKQRSIQ